MTRPALPRHLQSDHGFSLIELLVVIMVIGILTSIAIPAFAAQKTRADDASTKSAVRNAQTALESLSTATGTYDTDAATLADSEPSLKDIATLEVEGSELSTFRISVTSKHNRTFTVERLADSTIRRTCSPAGEGSCPTGGSW